MTILRPGNFDITDRGVEIAGLRKGDRILDIGCGQGDTLNHLIKDFGMTGEGIDMSLPRISEAKEKYPDLDVKFGDGEFLDEYSSFSFDGVFMECVLSLINIPDEALHEAYCVLKKGGKLIISDLYDKKPDPMQLKAVKIEADRQSRIPKKNGECEEHPTRFVDFRLDGVFFRDPLIAQREEIGYKVLAFEDRSQDLDNYIAQTLMDEGTLENLCADKKTIGRKNTGYFLLVAQKPE